MYTLRSDAALRLGYFWKAKGISKQVKEDCFRNVLPSLIRKIASDKYMYQCE